MRCKICLKDIEQKNKFEDYHDKCFRSVFGTIKISSTLPFSRKEFKTEKAQRSNKRFSISGVQPKLLISITENSLDVTSNGGTHIIKVSPEEYPFAAENEHLTMEIMRFLEVETAKCALISMSDGELSYITKRFDRNGGEKIHQEDMMQAMGISHEGESKYNAKSYEEVAFFLKEKGKSLIIVGEFFKRVVYNFFLGNSDYHLKNISIRLNSLGKLELTPNYDSVNDEIYQAKGSLHFEMALDLLKDKNSEKFDLLGHHSRYCFDEFARKIGINQDYAAMVYENYIHKYEKILEMVENSFLPRKEKQRYLKSLEERFKKFCV